LHIWLCGGLICYKRVNFVYVVFCVSVVLHRHRTCRGPKKICQSSDSVPLELEVISTAPKAFVIENFLSEFEVSEIISIADPQTRVSTVGNRDGGGTRTDSTRTSKNAWVGRRSSVVIESLFVRAEHLLKIDRLDQKNTEDMQVCVCAC
jgi:hypothetical protein